MSGKRKPDFEGWATKYGIKCSDGRTILPGAFSDMDGKKVPIVFGHIHDDPDMILGHAILHSRPEGIWTEGFLNNGNKAQSAREALINEDIEGLSIYANELQHVNGREVQHGNIRELSLVLAGANKGATIENVLLAHGDLLDELDDEVVIYSDDMPLMHSEEAAQQQKEEASEGEVDPQKIWDSMTPEQQELCSFLIGEAADGNLDDEDDDEEDDDSESEESEDEDEDAVEEEGDEGTDESSDEPSDEAEHSAIDEDDPEAIWNSMTPAQQELCAVLVDEAASGNMTDDTAEHSENEEDTDMKENAFDRNKTHPDDFLSHADQKAIIERAKACGSMRQAWKEALENNETLAHSVFNDDGTEQTYGIANIDYLFPEYTELNDRPEMIRRPDEWVGVVMDGVTKTPKSRLKTTVANITMEEARAKGYTKGDKKDAEVFNLLHRTVDPQTIYKYQELDQDDLIDIDEFDVVAWMKGEMRIMLNEEIARAILIGDGRLYNDKYKIKEDHIKPVVNDDDLYTIKITVKAGTDQDEDVANAQTAKNAIRSFIKGRKHYKGSGNLVYFTSEDWLSEMLLLEDGFGHELYKDATELAKKLRVNRIVTCPFLEDLTVDGQKVMAIALDLRDYVTGTNRRGKVTFFDDFDIEFNKNQYLIETRLSGMLRRPFSAMVVKIGTAQKGGPRYEEVTPVGTENPKSEHWFEKEGAIYRPSADKTVVANKTYYARTTDVPVTNENPQGAEE